MNFEKEYNEALGRAKTVLENAYAEETKTACREIFPCLAESEDERIRKEIRDFLIDMECKKEWIAYMEKQKEQKPLSTEETELNSLAFLSQMGYTCIPPKKEHQNNSDAPKNALGGGLNSPLDKDKNLDDIAQEYVEGVKKYNPTPDWNLIHTAVCYGYHYREQEEHSMSAEEEWSEEDETRLNQAITALESYSEWHLKYYGIAKYKDVIAWLKSLRPSWNPSEQEKGALQTAIHILTDGGSIAFTKAAVQLQNILDAFEGKESRKDWKPSEEQMNALRRAVNKLAKSDVADSVRLSIMYDNLKKLI